MKFPEQYRIDNLFIPYVSNDQKRGWFKIPHFEIENHFFNAVVLNVDDWQHVTVTVFESGKRPNRCATWEEMCFIKSLFWDDEETVIQFHPPKSEYISNHPFALHLWKPVNTEIPLPPSDLVGEKEPSKIEQEIKRLIDEYYFRKQSK